MQQTRGMGFSALRGAVLADDRTRPPLRHVGSGPTTSRTRSAGRISSEVSLRDLL